MLAVRLLLKQVMKRLFALTAAGILTVGAALAQDGAKDNAKKAGQDVKEAGKDTGRAAKHTGKAVAKGTKKGVNKAADATENGARKVKKKTGTS
jgi:hypothetical protein